MVDDGRLLPILHLCFSRFSFRPPSIPPCCFLLLSQAACSPLWFKLKAQRPRMLNLLSPLVRRYRVITLVHCGHRSITARLEVSWSVSLVS